MVNLLNVDKIKAMRLIPKCLIYHTTMLPNLRCFIDFTLSKKVLMVSHIRLQKAFSLLGGGKYSILTKI